jgi:4-hydroxythreonine-4-phosphate dehydrogenase
MYSSTSTTLLDSALPVAITMGDPAGIGPEIILKAFAQSPELTHACCVFGDLPTLQKQLSLLAPLLPRHLECLPITDLAQVGQSLDYQMPVIQCGDSAQIAMGQISAQAGAMAAAAISAATAAALTGKVAALVTAPVNKKALQLSGVEFPGHTEMLQSLTAQHLGLSISGLPVRMMLSCPGLRVVLVSIHVPLSEAISLVNFENVLQTFQVTHDSWLKVHGTVPRMTVAGLNPHAGEEGLFGYEEIRFIAPAIKKAQALGMHIRGPYPPDTVFMQAHSSQGQKDTDVVIAMYHDQGLIPVKYLGLDNGVNQTLGLPFVRTSPDHGTAFDIAGKGVANPSSLLAALKVATGQRL